MANKFLIKRGDGAPSQGAIDEYELVYDYTNNQLYTKVGSTITPIGSSPTSGSNNQLLTDDGSGGINSEGSLTFDGNHFEIENSSNGRGVQLNTNSEIKSLDGASWLHLQRYVDGNVAIGNNSNSDLYVANQLGIGTSSPSQPLHINAAYPQVKLQKTNDATYTTFGSGESYFVANIINPSSKTYEFRNNSTAQLSITTGGVVDIPGSLTLGTALALAEGGTGATSAAGARTNLQLGDLALLDTIPANLISSGTIADARIPSTVFKENLGTLTGGTTTENAKATGLYQVNETGHSTLLVSFTGVGGSTRSLELYAHYNDELYFRAGRDSETNFDSVGRYDNKIWHSGNDGANSGLDADTLDGSHASAFLTSSSGLNGSNITSGTIASARLDADTAHLSGNQTFTGTKTFQNALKLQSELDFTGNGNKNIDVETLEGSNYLQIRHHNPVGNAFENAIRFNANGGALIYYDGSNKIETTNTGATVTGALNVTGALSFGSISGAISTSGNINTQGAYQMDGTTIIDTSKVPINIPDPHGSDRTGSVLVTDYAGVTSPTVSGWYTIASGAHSAARGGGIISIGFTGGYAAPKTFTCDFQVGWGGDLHRCNISNETDVITKARLIRTSSTTELQAYFEISSGLSDNPQTMRVAFTRDKYNPYWGIEDPLTQESSPSTTGEEVNGVSPTGRGVKFYSSDTNLFEINNSYVTINELGKNIDFRVESSSDANLLFTDGGNDRVGIGTNSPSVKLDIAGDVKSSGTINAERLNITESGTIIGDIQATDSTWLRINQSTNKNIYTPRYIRADNGFFVDGASQGITGNATFRAPNHSVGNPAYSFAADTNTGMYLISGDNLGFSTGGTLRAQITSNGINTLNSNGYYIDDRRIYEVTSNSTERGGYHPIVASIRNSGKQRYLDEDFAHSTNSVNLYNNAGGSNLVVSRITASDDSIVAPNSSGKVIKVAYNGNGTTSPGFGGVYQLINTEKNHTFVQIFQAKLPSGRTFVTAANSMGTGAIDYFLTSPEGTGKWEWYARVCHAGTGGTFSTSGFIYVTGGSDSAFTWYIANMTQYDVTETPGDYASQTGYYRSNHGVNARLARGLNDDDRIEIEASETKIYGDTVERARFGSYGIRNGYTGSATTPSYSFKDDTDTGMYKHDGNTLGFSVGGGVRSTINSSGVLYVTNAVQAGNNGVQIWDGTHGFKQVLAKDSTYTYLRNNDGTPCIQVGDTGDGTNYYQNGTHKFRSAAGSEYMRIDSSGNVGIGVSPSGGKLHVNGDLRVIGKVLGVFNTGFVSTDSVGNQATLMRQTSGDIMLIGDTNHTEQIKIQSANSTGNGYIHCKNDGGIGFTGNTQFSSPMTVNYGAVFNEGGHNSDTRIEGDTDTNLFRADASTDRIGIGSGSPGGKLHVHGITNANNLIVSAVMHNVGGGHLSNYQTLLFKNTQNETGYAAIRHFANSHNDSASQLRFLTSNTSGVMANQMTVDDTGRIGIGTTSPSLSYANKGLEIEAADEQVSLRLQRTGSSPNVLEISARNSDTLIYNVGTARNFRFGIAGTEEFRMDTLGNFHADADIIAFSTTTASDIKFKENVKSIPYGLKEVLQMNPVQFDWIEKRNGTHDIGFIAQEMEKIVPEVIKETETLEVGGTHKTMDYAKLTSILVQAIQEQQQQINKLEEKLNG